MTDKPEGHEFLKVSMPAKMLRDLDDALKLRGVHRARSWLLREIVTAFIEDTKLRIENGETFAKEDECDS